MRKCKKSGGNRPALFVAFKFSGPEPKEEEQLAHNITLRKTQVLRSVIDETHRICYNFLKELYFLFALILPSIWRKFHGKPNILRTAKY